MGGLDLTDAINPQAQMRGVGGCIKLLDFSLSSIGWRRGLGRGGLSLLVSPLLSPLPTRASWGEDESLMQPSECARSVSSSHFDKERGCVVSTSRSTSIQHQAVLWIDVLRLALCTQPRSA